jgi:putative transcriptional regulator
LIHPSEETLLTLASGAADLPLRALVEGHLSSCAACQATVRELTLAGGALLGGLAPAPLPDELWQRVRARVVPEDRPAKTRPDPLSGLPLPEGARRELSLAGPLVWRAVWASRARYALLQRPGESALLLAHMPAGHGFPRHFHPGREDVLVLAGGYDDERGRYEVGDYAIYEPGTAHRPQTEKGEECWILVRVERPIQFLGWRGWLQRRLARSRS